jgi:transposase
MMSLNPDNEYQIPALTIKIARAAFPNGDNIFMKMRDECGVIYSDADFADLFAARGKPAEAPGRLALVTIMQYVEGMTDREAADAVRSRIDMKYALGLKLEDAGFHYSVLSKFRRRLLADGAEERLLARLLTALTEKELLSAGGKQRTDSTHILGAIRTLNRLELVGETLRHALNKLAAIVPDWLQSWVSDEWYEAYGEPINGYRLPKDKTEQSQLALAIGQDGVLLLSHIDLAAEYKWLSQVPAIQTLRQVWWQQYCYDENGAWRWRADKETPPASVRIVSPHDTQARQGKKRETKWLGYKVHLTETCDPQLPKLVTHVETRIACQQDYMATETIHQALADKELLPEQHVVDTAYISGAQLVTSRDTYGIDLLGPVLPDTSWQAQDGAAYDLTQFQLIWSQEKAVCPQGHDSMSWTVAKNRYGKPIIRIHFSRKTCSPCPVKALCTTSKTHGRQVAVRPQAAHEAIQSRRQYMETDAFREAYAIRAGVEGVISQAAYALRGRRTRYRGLAKTHLQNLATAAAINLRRGANWLMGKETAKTAVSRFAALAPA